MNIEELVTLMDDLKEVADRIVMSDKLVMSLDDTNTRKIYEEDIINMIEMYDLMESVLKQYPGFYEDYVKHNGYPLTFIRKKLEKKLNEKNG